VFVALINTQEYSKHEDKQQVSTYFLKELLLKYDKEPLLSTSDLSRMYQNSYEDFPECFHLEVWKFTFFSGQALQEVVKRQLSFENTLSGLLKKRQLYSINMQDVQNRNDKTKEEILKKMQGRLMDVLAEVSEREFERKNLVLVEQEYLLKDKRKTSKKISKI